jgi:microcystin-dependent protein
MEPFLGEIKIFAFDYAPKDWALCDGRQLSIQQNNALYSLLGVTYGGDGRTVFNLPNLMDNIPIGMGNGPGLTPRPLGQRGGQREVILGQSELPSHSHPPTGATLMDAIGNDAIGHIVAKTTDHRLYASTGMINTSPAFDATGNNIPHNNMQPFLTIGFYIALRGYYPGRN